MLARAVKRLFVHGKAARAAPRTGRHCADSKEQRLFLAQMRNFFAYDGSEQLPIDEEKL